VPTFVGVLAIGASLAPAARLHYLLVGRRLSLQVTETNEWLTEFRQCPADLSA
jgi:hypothetical protein